VKHLPFRSRSDLPHPAPFGLAIMALVAAMQRMMRAKPAKA
jgi:hypothetical protein